MHKHDVIMSNHDEIRHEIYLSWHEIFNFMHNQEVIMSNQGVFMSNHLKTWHHFCPPSYKNVVFSAKNDSCNIQPTLLTPRPGGISHHARAGFLQIIKYERGVWKNLVAENMVPSCSGCYIAPV